MKSNFEGRERLLISVLVFFGFVIFCRLFYLQVIRHEFFTDKSLSQLKRIIRLYPHRGHIYDRNKKPFALTQLAFSTYAIPEAIENKWVFSKLVAPHIGMERQALSDKLYKSRSPFIWLNRQNSQDEKKALDALELDGVGFIKTEKRVYPQPFLASHVLGFVGIDNQGLGGLEYKFDKRLKGSPGKIVLEGDPRGKKLLSGTKKTIPANNGTHIVTTLDSYIQYISQVYLEEGILKMKAKKGHVIVMDPKNGDILAMASYPQFNGNEWKNSSGSERKNIAIQDIFEPGSVFKVFTLAAVLEEELVSPKTTLYVPETLTLYNRTIKEAHRRDKDDPDTVSVSEIIQKSLNVGTSLLAQKLGEEKFYQYISEFGFGKRTGIELPGEAKGILRPLKRWSGVDIAMISFGQGVAVTSLQLTAAVAAIANDGVYVKPRIVDYFSDHNFETRKAVPIQTKGRIISKRTAGQVKEIMYKVVERGTGGSAKIKGYSIGGKTGTAQKPKENGLGYAKGEYVSSFVGFFPVYDPQYVIYVVVDTPKKSIWGSTTAGPIFRKIAKDIIDYKDILPDRYISKNKKLKLSQDALQF
jgi:cell division protein FtsI/penicillin-binding protein 2